MKLKRKRKLANIYRKYDLETKRNHNFFANGILVHNSNFRAGLIDGELLVGSHNCLLVEEENNLYWKMAREYFLEEKLRSIGGDIIVYGEIYGPGVQDLSYGNEKAMRIFDINLDTRYVNFHELESYARAMNLDMVPILARGKYSKEFIDEHVGGNTTLDKDHIREGIVIKPVMERWDKSVSRVILKYINDDYLLRKSGTERH